MLLLYIETEIIKETIEFIDDNGIFISSIKMINVCVVGCSCYGHIGPGSRGASTDGGELRTESAKTGHCMTANACYTCFVIPYKSSSSTTISPRMFLIITL